MHIKKMNLKDFRNYDQIEIDFSNKVNVIIGQNAQGKTNLLEAIYVLAFTKSYRALHDKELIRWNKPFAKINGLIKKKDQKTPLEIIFHHQGKKAKKNNIEQRKLSDYIGLMNVVMFAPEDLSLVKGSPRFRRRFLNMEISQIEPIYVYHLSQYQQILKQRNQLLKFFQQQKSNDHHSLDIFTEQLIEQATKIVMKRFEFLNLLKKWAIPIHKEISQQRELLNIIYSSNVKVLEDDDEVKIKQTYKTTFEAVKHNEIRRGTTLIGPHRDDLNFQINEVDVKLYGSQGQQRTTSLSLKLAEIDLIYHIKKHYPILLLDDVLSELDDYRQSHLLNTIQGKVQTFVSTTTIDGIDHETISRAMLYKVTDGKINKL